MHEIRKAIRAECFYNSVLARLCPQKRNRPQLKRDKTIATYITELRRLVYIALPVSDSEKTSSVFQLHTSFAGMGRMSLSSVMLKGLSEIAKK